MKKVIFTISDQLSDQIEDTMRRAGFTNRTEFFRYLAIEFIQRNTGKKYIERDDEELEIPMYGVPRELIEEISREAQTQAATAE